MKHLKQASETTLAKTHEKHLKKRKECLEQLAKSPRVELLVRGSNPGSLRWPPGRPRPRWRLLKKHLQKHLKTIANIYNIQTNLQHTYEIPETLETYAFNMHINATSRSTSATSR
jgi:hypothetical protein